MAKYIKNSTSEFITKLSRLQFFCGLCYIWVDPDGQTPGFLKIINKIFTLLLIAFITSEYVSFFTQNNLTEKQATDLILFAISHPVMMSYSWSTLYYKEDIKNLLVKLTITLKNKYNNKKIEEDMLRKAVLYSSAYVASCSVALFFYAFDAVVQVLKSGGTFTTVVVAWPDVAEIGLLPDTVRIIAYAMWWYFMIRASAVYVLVISLTILLSHQYKILQDYFYSLENIFKADVKLEEKENDYENALKFGISIHAETMWCVKECQKVCNWVFSGQIGINFTVFCMLMLQMVNSERTLMSVLATLSTGLALLTTTGFFMCNAGDITVEAGLLPRAIFSSGWQNCRGDASIRVRKLITLAIAQSQAPIVMRSFNLIELSYRSYVSIVKSSYSLFSILY